MEKARRTRVAQTIPHESRWQFAAFSKLVQKLRGSIWQYLCPMIGKHYMTRYRKFILAVLAAVLTLAILRLIIEGESDTVLTVFGAVIFERLMKKEDDKDSQT